MPPPVEQYSEREGLPVEAIQQFYRDLYSEMKTILKPYGFCKKKDRFRRLLANGIFWEIEIQRQDFKMALMFHFTVNIHAGFAPSVAEKDLWTIPDGPKQLWGHLGESPEDGWHHQKWYDLSALVDPQVRAQVVDGQFPLTFKEPGQDWKTVWIPYPSPEQIREEREDISSLSPSSRQLHSDMLQRMAERLRVYRELQDLLTKRACSPSADPPSSP